MRSLITVLALFTATSAFAACPNLAGKYASCRSTTGSSSGSSDIVVTQELKNGVTTYSITATSNDDQERSTQTYIADGKTRTETETIPNSDIVLTSSQTASCVGDKLQMSLIGSAEGQTIAEIKMLISKSGKTITMVSKGSIFGQGIDDTDLCE